MLTTCLAFQLRPQPDPAPAACAAAGPTAVHQLASLQPAVAAAAAVAQNRPRLQQVQVAVALRFEHHLAAQAYKAGWVAPHGPIQELALMLLCNMCTRVAALTRHDDPAQTTEYSVLKFSVYSVFSVSKQF